MNPAVQLASRTFKSLSRFNNNRAAFYLLRDNLSNVASVGSSSADDKLGGYAKAFEKFENQLKEEKKQMPEQQTFASLLRNSKFIDLGDPNGKVVIGKIIKVVDDDLYIDFGWKFHCVCTRPKNKTFTRGSKVRVLLKDLELSTKFLGYEKDVTLLETDAVLLGMVGGKE